MDLKFDLERVEQPAVPIEQPVRPAEQPVQPVEQAGPGKNMEEVLRNLEAASQREIPRSGKSMEEVLRNLENLKLKESGRSAVTETTAGGIVRETIAKIADAVRTPEARETGNTMQDVQAAAKDWHLQQRSDTCAVACQEFIIKEYTGSEVTEHELWELAVSNNWFKEGGTPPEDIGKLLEIYGIDSDINYSATLQDLKQALSEGNRTIVGVNNTAIFTEWCDYLPIATANHAIEVIGIDESDPENVRVIINDPGVEDGRGKSISLENFMDAWRTSGGYMMTAYRSEGVAR